MPSLKSLILSITTFPAMLYGWFVVSSFMKTAKNPWLGRSIASLTGKNLEDIGLEDLLTLTRDQLITVFHTLPAPPFDEMRGEYKAVPLDCGGALRQLLADVTLHRLWGKWQGKSFEPLGVNHGHGYNTFRVGRANRDERALPAGMHALARPVLNYLLGTGEEETIRIIRMKTRGGASIYDNSPSFHLEYHDYTPFPISTMRDEVRKVSEGLYLGLGILGITFGPRNIFPFALVGPPSPWVGPDAGYDNVGSCKDVCVIE